MIEIIEVIIVEESSARTAIIFITNMAVTWKLGVGGLPLTGDLQPILDSRFDELWQLANQLQIEPDVYSTKTRRALKALALAVLDEINILRNIAGLPLRDASQIDDAVKNKLKLL